jgi:hypothetical protein
VRQVRLGVAGFLDLRDIGRCAGSSKPVVTSSRVALPAQASTKKPMIAAATSKLPIAGAVHRPRRPISLWWTQD